MTLFIGNLNYDLTDYEIREAFKPFGEVKSVKIIEDRETHRSKGFGFVEFATEDEAKKAISELDGSELAGRKLHVSVARPRKK